MYLLNNKLYGYKLKKFKYIEDWSKESILNSDFYNYVL